MMQNGMDRTVVSPLLIKHIMAFEKQSKKASCDKVDNGGYQNQADQYLLSFPAT
jgi:hypothetical protein